MMTLRALRKTSWRKLGLQRAATALSKYDPADVRPTCGQISLEELRKLQRLIRRATRSGRRIN